MPVFAGALSDRRHKTGVCDAKLGVWNAKLGFWKERRWPAGIGVI